VQARLVQQYKFLSCRPPSALVRPQDVEGDRHHSGPARVQMESLPSAPPLPESHAHALHAASSCHSLACGSAQHVQYPCLHASPRIENSMRAGLSQSRQGQQEDQTNVAQDTVGQTAGGSLGAGDLDPGQGGDSAGAGPAVQPAGGLAWAMQTAAGASSAAVSALSAWLPWHHDSSTAKSTGQEQQPELQAQAVPQTVPSCRRCSPRRISVLGALLHHHPRFTEGIVMSRTHARYSDAPQRASVKGLCCKVGWQPGKGNLRRSL